jgi:hypothetical protein
MKLNQEASGNGTRLTDAVTARAGAHYRTRPPPRTTTGCGTASTRNDQHRWLQKLFMSEGIDRA